MKLSIVIHTEEEFDWAGGFYRSNNQVTHGRELIEFCEKLIANVNAKITFALDYAFVTSEQGKQVIGHFNQHHPQSVEFATHLHPWVNPPFTEEQDQVCETESYPGNLPAEMEMAKLRELTQKISEVSGIRPTTYLAGRYGVGPNTAKCLKELGYKCDISISPFCDFSHQQGPDFSSYNNDVHEANGVINWPHTTAITSILHSVAQWFNRHPASYEQYQKNPIARLLMKLLRVKRQRLSPEGFSLDDLKKVASTQIKLGANQLILSMHSPSVKAGLTPYVQTTADEKEFYQKTEEFIAWFQGKYKGKPCTVRAQENR